MSADSDDFSSLVTERAALYRALDAGLNRATEGLRVIEDWVRYGLDDSHLTGLCKDLRHELIVALAPVSSAHRLAARHVDGDVGTQIEAADEYVREDTQGLLAANSRRVQQALRSLEELVKLIDPSVAGQIETLRYRSYTIESAIGATRRGCESLDQAHLYVLIDGGESLAQLADNANILVEAGVDVLQLRDKRLADRELLERAKCLRQITAGTATRLIINDRPDLAVLARADGVHVGQDELTVSQVRQIVGHELLVGVSTHSLDQARQAVVDGANYLGIGPTFESQTKQFDRFPGLEFVQAVCAEVSLPAFAIGGVDSDNVEQVIAAGCRRVAVSGAIHRAADPAQAVIDLKQMLLSD